LKKEKDMAGGNDVKDEFKTVAHVIQQLTGLTEGQAEQLEEMLIDGFTDTNGVTDKTSAYETLVSVINEPKYKEWKDAGEGSLDMYPSLWQDCTRKAMIWKKEQRLAQAELNKKAELRDKTQRGLIVDLSSRLEANGKTLVNNSKTSESLQLDFDASEASKTALSERVAAMKKEKERTRTKMEGLQLQVSKYKAHAVVTDDGEAAQSAMSRAEIEGVNEKVLESVHNMLHEVYGRLNQVEERQGKLGDDIVGSMTQLPRCNIFLKKEKTVWQAINMVRSKLTYESRLLKTRGAECAWHNRARPFFSGSVDVERLATFAGDICNLPIGDADAEDEEGFFPNDPLPTHNGLSKNDYCRRMWKGRRRFVFKGMLNAKGKMGPVGKEWRVGATGVRYNATQRERGALKSQILDAWRQAKNKGIDSAAVQMEPAVAETWEEAALALDDEALEGEQQHEVEVEDVEVKAAALESNAAEQVSDGEQHGSGQCLDYQCQKEQCTLPRSGWVDGEVHDVVADKEGAATLESESCDPVPPSKHSRQDGGATRGTAGGATDLQGRVLGEPLLGACSTGQQLHAQCWGSPTPILQFQVSEHSSPVGNMPWYQGFGRSTWCEWGSTPCRTGTHGCRARAIAGATEGGASAAGLPRAGMV
jgi:hypothetical protein